LTRNRDSAWDLRLPLNSVDLQPSTLIPKRNPETGLDMPIPEVSSMYEISSLFRELCLKAVKLYAATVSPKTSTRCSGFRDRES